MRLQHFPASWKHAHIAVIPKKGAKSSPSDYRPISLLSAISKIADRAILYALNFTKEHKIIPDEQFGFRAHHIRSSGYPSGRTHPSRS
ncbi:hypothetical protein GWI33_008949 [Rhynchophorus ferrugineus]|uniref:Uncharacterized protein n=1 Tax=Rhynchophorus ferrugineus TaxID=354439 RepID=A0A834IE42_RHYFE|nr:hypothetical protein GWI33_008949 [Rhynchophorus ferrugineus]